MMPRSEIWRDLASVARADYMLRSWDFYGRWLYVRRGRFSSWRGEK